MNQDHSELGRRILLYMTQNSPLIPPLIHNAANANIAIICRIVACLLEGMNEIEITDWLELGYKPETAKRFLSRAKIFYDYIVKNSPEEFSEYLLPKTKNVTSKKKKLPKLNESLPSADPPSTHVNADGSIVEMKDVLNEEEKAI